MLHILWRQVEYTADPETLQAAAFFAQLQVVNICLAQSSHNAGKFPVGKLTYGEFGLLFGPLFQCMGVNIRRRLQHQFHHGQFAVEAMQCQFKAVDASTPPVAQPYIAVVTGDIRIGSGAGVICLVARLCGAMPVRGVQYLPVSQCIYTLHKFAVGSREFVHARPDRQRIVNRCDCGDLHLRTAPEILVEPVYATAIVNWRDNPN